ncbi:hypothetical protein WA577_004913 [Blastocystis sp. JDR]
MNAGRSRMNAKKELIGTDPDRSSLEHSRLLLEQENDSHLSELHSKLSSLKDIAIDIHSEVDSSNRYLDEMDSQMSRANSGLSKTLNKVGKLLSNADQPTLIVLVLVIVLAFVIIWKLFLK